MEVGGSDRLQTPINQSHLTGQSSLPLVVPTANMVTQRCDRGGKSKVQISKVAHCLWKPQASKDGDAFYSTLLYGIVCLWTNQ